MSDWFISEIRTFSFGMVPHGWMSCAGQLLSIAQNQQLYSLLGTTYGGDGQRTFALPDLRGAAAVHAGPGFAFGQTGGETGHTLTAAEMPPHTHAVMGSSANANAAPAAGGVLAAASNVYRSADNLTALDPSSIAPLGASQPHQNMQPFLVLNFCIALTGDYPPKN